MGLLSGHLARDSRHIVISDRKLYFPARVSELSLDVRAVISHAVSLLIDCVLEMYACIECAQANDLERYAALQEQYQLLGGYDIVTDDGGLEESRFRWIMGSFVVAGEVFDLLLETFSQGQLEKVDLTRFLLNDADMQIWDEPLNYIAVLSRD